MTTTELDALPLVDDELDVLDAMVPLAGLRVVELGCGAARLARALLERHPDARVTGLEVDARQHAKNLANPCAGLEFVAGGAQAIPFPDASFDLALMLKSLHHVPLPLLGRALAETARVLRPGGRIAVFDKFLRDDASSGLLRTLAEPLARLVGTALNRRLGDIVAASAAASGATLEKTWDEPAMLGDFFRSAGFRRA